METRRYVNLRGVLLDTAPPSGSPCPASNIIVLFEIGRDEVSIVFMFFWGIVGFVLDKFFKVNKLIIKINKSDNKKKSKTIYINFIKEFLFKVKNILTSNINIFINLYV